MKKKLRVILSTILVCTFMLLNTQNVFAYSENTHLNEVIKPMKIDYQTNFTVSTGKSYSRSFKMIDEYNTWADPHNNFTVKVSNFSGGKYKIIITATNGYRWESSEHSSGTTVTTRNCSHTATYTVYITNTSYGDIRGTVSLNSFY